MSDDLGNKSASDELKRKILSSMNTSFTGEATNRWITAIKDEAFDEVEEAVMAATESSKLNHSMAAVIDRLFDNFKRYSFEYNRTQEDREFEINAERPASMRTSADYQDMGKPIKYCLGHLASRHWALIVQGEENRILVYITPVEFLVGFRPSPSEFPPHLEMRLARDTGKTSREFVWTIGGQMLSQDSLPVLARRLFTQLVKVAKGEANYGEPFALSPQEEKLALAQSVTAPIDRSFEKETSNLLGQKKPDLSERTFVVAAEPVDKNAALAAHLGGPPPVMERPPLNVTLNANPASSFASSSNHPQVAAAIANGEPKALNPPPEPVAGFPTSQTMSEQAQTFQKIPNPMQAHTPQPPQSVTQTGGHTPAPILAPAKTFVVEPQLSSDDAAIAALIFPAPPGEESAPEPYASASSSFSSPSTSSPSASSSAHAAPPASAEPAEIENTQPAAPANGNGHTDDSPVSQKQNSDSPRVSEAAAAESKWGASSPSQHEPVSPWVGPNGEPARVPSSSRSMEMNAITKSDNGEGIKQDGSADLAKRTADTRANIAQSLKGLFDTVDGAIGGLTAVGMEAMHADDLLTVSAVMKQTKALKSLRDSVVALSKDWQKTNDEV